MDCMVAITDGTELIIDMVVRHQDERPGRLGAVNASVIVHSSPGAV
jgi:hypothetical protein